MSGIEYPNAVIHFKIFQLSSEEKNYGLIPGSFSMEDAIQALATYLEFSL
jgi:hypothetical protein